MQSKSGKRRRRIKGANSLRKVSRSLFAGSAAQPYDSTISRSASSEQFPLVFAADKLLILRRSLLLILLTPTLLWLSLATKGLVGVFPFMVCVWLIFRYGSYLKAVVRVFDRVSLNRDKVELFLLGKKRNLKWGQIKSIGVDASFWDGICYNLKLADGSEIRFTDKIKYHLDLYNQIVKRVAN